MKGPLYNRKHPFIRISLQLLVACSAGRCEEGGRLGAHRIGTIRAPGAIIDWWEDGPNWDKVQMKSGWDEFPPWSGNLHQSLGCGSTVQVDGVLGGARKGDEGRYNIPDRAPILISIGRYLLLSHLPPLLSLSLSCASSRRPPRYRTIILVHTQPTTATHTPLHTPFHQTSFLLFIVVSQYGSCTTQQSPTEAIP